MLAKGNSMYSSIASQGEIVETRYVFNYAVKALYEDKSSGTTSFIYALTKQIARVEGVVGGKQTVSQS